MTLDDFGGWRGVLGTLTAGQDLTSAQAGAATEAILSGEATAAQIAAFIVALRMKGEAPAEVTGMVDAMLAAATPIDLGADAAGAVDLVGTGGGPTRRTHALNVSTMACFVVAGAGIKVCKHGNRKASSTSGSFDLLDALGVPIELDGEAVATCVKDAGIGFCFAARFHPAMRHAGPIRRELGVPTVFNFLGPMANPARVKRQVVGVSDPSMAERMAGVLQAHGAERALVVFGHDGLDELTTTTTSTVVELRDGELRRYDVDPADFGLGRVQAADLRGGDAATNVGLTKRVLDGEAGAHRDVVVLNAGAALLAAGLADDLADGIALAIGTIEEGRAAAALDRLVATSQAAAMA
jgi:anthranilate phosphoribosyltransferase